MRYLGVILNIFVLISLCHVQTAFAEDLDLTRIYRCDAFITNAGSSDCSGQIVPKGTVENQQVVLRNNVGIEIPRGHVNLPTPDKIRVITRSRPGADQEAQRPGRRPEAGSKATAPGETGEESTQPTQNGSAVQSATRDGRGQGYGFGGMGAGDDSGSNFQGGSFNGPGSGYSSPNVKAGLLYADDEDAASNSEIKAPQIKPGAVGMANVPSMSAVDLNRKMAAAGGESEDGSGFGGGSSGGGMGASLPGSAAAGKAGKKAAGSKDFISAMADKLRDGINAFLGLSGSSDSGGGTGGGRGLAGANGPNGKKTGKAGQALSGKDHRDLLKASFERYKKGLANSLEFGDSRSFLFQSMCQHYIDYARANSIPNDRGPCPVE